MSFKSSIICYTAFDQSPVSDIKCTLSNTGGSISLDSDGVFNSCYKMEPGKKLTLTDSTIPATNGKFTISFWLKSKTYQINNNAKSVILPIVCRSTFAKANRTWGAVNPVWLIQERTNSTGKNSIFFSISGYIGTGYTGGSGGTGASSPSLSSAIPPGGGSFISSLPPGILDNATEVSCQIQSSEYDVNVFNHFCFTFNGGKREVKLFINGKEDTAGSFSGYVAGTLRASSTPISFNSGAIGADTQVAYNNALLDEFAYFNYDLTDLEIQRIINHGVKYVGDTSFSDLEEIYQSAIFDDPQTVDNTSIFLSRGSILIGKSDGEIIKGTRSIWESRKEFISQKDLENLEIFKKNNEESEQIVEGKLILKSQTIRI